MALPPISGLLQMIALEKLQVSEQQLLRLMLKIHPFTFTANAEGRTIALRCKYINAAYTDSPKTGKRNVTIDTSGG